MENSTASKTDPDDSVVDPFDGSFDQPAGPFAVPDRSWRPRRALAAAAAAAVLGSAIFVLHANGKTAGSRPPLPGDRPRTTTPVDPLPQRPAPAEEPSAPAPEGTESPARDEPFDVSAALDELFARAYGDAPSPAEPDRSDGDSDDDANPSEAAGVRFDGAAPDGSAWSVTHPSNWNVDDQGEVVYFLPPGGTASMSIVMRRQDEPLESAAKRAVAELEASLEDAEVVSFTPSRTSDGLAYFQAVIHYSNRGQPSAAHVSWVANGFGTMYTVVMDTVTPANDNDIETLHAVHDSFEFEFAAASESA